MENKDKNKNQIGQKIDDNFIAELIPIQITLETNEGIKELQPLRVILDYQFQPFLKQELKKLKHSLSDQERAFFDCWFTFFMEGQGLKPRKIPSLKSIFYPDKYLKKYPEFIEDSVFQTIDREVKKLEAKLGQKIEDPVIKAYACFERDVENKSIKECFQYALNYPSSNYSEETLDEITNELVDLSNKVNQKLNSQEIRSKIARINSSTKKHPEEFIKHPERLKKLRDEKDQIFNKVFQGCWEDYLENLGKRIEDEGEKWKYLRNIRKGLENMYLTFLDKTASTFTERLKPYLTEGEVDLFKLFYCRQEIFGNRVLYYDVVEQGLLRGEDLYKFGIGLLVVLIKIFGIKKQNDYDLEGLLNRAIKVYLAAIGLKRCNTKMDEIWLKKQLKNKKSTEPIDKPMEYKNGKLIQRDFEDKGQNPEEQYRQKENKGYLIGLIKKCCTPKEQEVLVLDLKGYKISEIAQQTGRTKSTIQELKDTGIKRIQKGLGKL